MKATIHFKKGIAYIRLYELHKKYVAGEMKDTSLYDITLHFNLKNRKIPFCTLIEINDKHYFYIDYLMLHHFFMQIENIDLDVYDLKSSNILIEAKHIALYPEKIYKYKSPCFYYEDFMLVISLYKNNFGIHFVYLEDNIAIQGDQYIVNQFDKTELESYLNKQVKHQSYTIPDKVYDDIESIVQLMYISQIGEK